MAEPAEAGAGVANGALTGWRYPRRMNAAAVLVDDAARRWPDRCALIHGERDLSYAELRVEVDCYGHALRAAGLRVGERFVCRMRNTPQAAIVLLAGIKIGAVPVPTFASVTDDELARTVEVSGAVGLVGEGAVDACAALRFAVAFGADGRPDDAFARLLSEAVPSLEPAPTDSDSIAMLCFSSGTTGRPKGLPHTHRNIVAIADSAVPRGLGGLGPGDVVLATSPFGFAYALAAMVFYPLRFGAASVCHDGRIDAALATSLIRRHGVTHLLTVPTLCARLLQADDAEALPSLRVVKVGGMPASEALQRQWAERYGVEMLPAFGMQELIGSAVTCSPSQHRRGTLGWPQPGCEVRVVLDDGAEASPGVPGRLWLRTPFTIPRYWSDERRTAEALRPDDWFVTDDLVTRDADGCLRYVGRADRTIISAGWSISPSEVETALATHPAVAEAVVVGVADAERGAVPVAAVVLRDAGLPADAARQALIGHVRATLAAYKCPRDIRFFTALPRTHTGKLALASIREAIERERAAPAVHDT